LAQESVAHANGVTEVLAKIDAQAMAALDSVHQIASGAEQQSANSAEIARHVEQIAESTHLNSHAANETAGMASHLAALASGMRSALAAFRG
jgi:methyl-accepting chemotaxis protein